MMIKTADTLVCFHPKTEDVALFKTGDEYWIGIYSAHITAQFAPPYYYYAGYWRDEATAKKTLDSMIGNEF